MNYPREAVTVLETAVNKAVELGMSPEQIKMELASYLFMLASFKRVLRQ